MSKSSQFTFHMIGNAHLDPAWMWRWPEGMQAFRATVRAALDRLQETPEFVFTCSQPAAYRWVEQTEPELFGLIQQKVREGSWAIVGGWWVQPDCNLPSGEGFIRQGLLGQHFFLQKFGRITDTGYCVDSFGHNGGLPQILLKSGLRNYVFTRPAKDELDLPEDLFWWESADGSRVLAYRIPYHYNNYDYTVEEKVNALFGDLRDRDRPPTEWMLFYGVGDHGGGPTRQDIETILQLEADPELPHLVFSSPERYFNHVRELKGDLPVVRNDLQYHAPGCYSAHSHIKQLNRRAENALLAAERWCCLAQTLAGLPYPADRLHDAWEQVCFNHFHDILCGTSIREACEDAVQTYGRAIAQATEASHLAMQRIASQVDTTLAGSSREVQAVLVFNPNGWETEEVVRFEFWYDIHKSLWDKPIHLRVVDSENRELPCQLVPASGKIGKDRVGVLFPARAPGLGYSTYVVRYGEQSAFAEERPVTQKGTALENAEVRLEIDPETGWIAGLFDKRHGVQVFAGPAARPVVLEDPTDTWGHGSGTWDQVVGVFTDATCRLVEHGPVRSTWRVRSSYNRSWIEQEFHLYRQGADIHVDVKLHWNESHKMLKLEFPLAVGDPVATYEIPYGVVEKPTDGRERPGQTWVDLTGRLESQGRSLEYGVSLANTAKYSYSVSGSTLFLTVLRSPLYAIHEPHQVGPDEPLDYQDQGEQRFSYRLRPHIGDWRQAQTPRMALELNLPLLPHLESGHPGQLGHHLTGIHVSAPNVVVCALKQAEAGDAFILRCYEQHGQGSVVELNLPFLGRRWSTTLSPFEIKTFRIPFDKSEPVSETSLIEIDLDQALPK